MQHDFEYVKPTEYGPVKAKLRELINKVELEMQRECFSFQSEFIGSTTLNMVTRDRKSNVGYDFDVNVYPNVDFDDYTPAELRQLFTKYFNKYAHEYGYSHCEDSTRVLTIKVKDTAHSKIKHSCDIGIVLYDDDDDGWYVHCNKAGDRKTYEFKMLPDPDEIEDKISWLKENGYWNQVRKMYLRLKNNNTDDDKKSRSLRLEAINNIFNEYVEYDDEEN